MGKTLTDMLKNNISLFWDVEPASLDPEKHKRYIIPRVMDYGTLENVKATFAYYGKQTILEVLKESPYLDKKTISFFAFYYDIAPEEFRSYRKRSSFKTWK